MDDAAIADLAEEFVREHAEPSARVQRLDARRERNNRAIAAWDEREAWAALPEDVQSLIGEARGPVISWADLVSLRRTILLTLAELGHR